MCATPIKFSSTRRVDTVISPIVRRMVFKPLQYENSPQQDLVQLMHEDLQSCKEDFGTVND